MSALPEENKLYAYEDYLTWDEDFRCELIDGVVYAMAGVSVSHSRANKSLILQIGNYLDGKTCELFYENFDVKFDKKTVVKPDLMVVCDPSILEERGCMGAPDLIIEILSPSTSRKDRITKLHLYEKFGVKEYWIVDPHARYVTVYILNGGKYGLAHKVYEETDTIPVHVLEDCNIDLTKVFENIPL